MLASRMKTVRGDLPQKAFANRLAVHVNTVQRWEAGTRLPCADDLAKIQQEFGININWLLTGEGMMLLGQGEVARVVSIEDAHLEQIRQWASESAAENSDFKAWFRYQFGKCFPEFKEWVEKKQGGGSSENSGPITHKNSA
jgi:transcriptional regulator with XRE-family HTH domain